ncbi:hypothetical protein FBQ96_00815 [Nitrospirales bacterium NOB]|nr:hypothetical protein [Nitrospirales bacterium NOB]
MSDNNASADENDDDCMDQKDYVLERIWRLKQQGVVFHSTDDDPDPYPNPSTGHSMFPSRQKFGGGK